MLQLDSRQ